MALPARRVLKLFPLDERHSISADELDARWTQGELAQGVAEEKDVSTGRSISRIPKQLVKRAKSNKREVHLVPRWMDCEDHWQALSKTDSTGNKLEPAKPALSRRSFTPSAAEVKKNSAVPNSDLKMTALAAGSFREAQKHTFAAEELEDAHTAARAILANSKPSKGYALPRKEVPVRHRGLLRFLRGSDPL